MLDYEAQPKLWATDEEDVMSKLEAFVAGNLRTKRLKRLWPPVKAEWLLWVSLSR